MLYLKNGRLYTHSISYIMPDGLCLVPDSITTAPDTLTFETLDGKFQLMLCPYETEKTPDEELNGFLKMGCHETMSDIFEVNRGGMTGKGVFYRDNSWSYEHYEERTRYPENEDGQNAFELYIEYEVQEESDRNKVREIMDDPKIKALIDSIRYEPDVCKKMINGK